MSQHFSYSLVGAPLGVPFNTLHFPNGGLLQFHGGGSGSLHGACGTVIAQSQPDDLDPSKPRPYGTLEFFSSPCFIKIPAGLQAVDLLLSAHPTAQADPNLDAQVAVTVY